MATITFTYTPQYDQKDIDDVKMLAPSLEYRIDVPENITLFVDDVYHHVNSWLRGLGYVIPE